MTITIFDFIDGSGKSSLLVRAQIVPLSMSNAQHANDNDNDNGNETMLTPKEMKNKFFGHGPMSGMPLYADASNGDRGRVMSVGPKWVTLMTAGGRDIKVPSDSIVSADH